MIKRTPFGSNFALSGFALGALTSAQSDELHVLAGRQQTALDALLIRVNDAARVGVAEAADWVSRRDQLSEDVNRLQLAINDLQTESGAASWRLELEHVAAQIDALASAVSAGTQGALTVERTNIALWTGAAILGSIGGVLVFRWWVKKRQRRR